MTPAGQGGRVETMSSMELAIWIRTVRLAGDPVRPAEIARDVRIDHPTDSATPRIVAMAEAKRRRLVSRN